MTRKQLHQLLRRALELNKHRDRLLLHIFAGQIKAIEAACDQLLAIPASTRNGQRLGKRYLKHRHTLFTFLCCPDLPADNNDSERALRKPVVHRKVSGSFRSAWGAQAFATITPSCRPPKSTVETPGQHLPLA